MDRFASFADLDSSLMQENELDSPRVRLGEAKGMLFEVCWEVSSPFFFVTFKDCQEGGRNLHRDSLESPGHFSNIQGEVSFGGPLSLKLRDRWTLQLKDPVHRVRVLRALWDSCSGTSFHFSNIFQVLQTLEREQQVKYKFGRWLVKGYPKVLLLDLDAAKGKTNGGLFNR